jgi:hypothetical protein
MTVAAFAVPAESAITAAPASSALTNFIFTLPLVCAEKRLACESSSVQQEATRVPELNWRVTTLKTGQKQAFFAGIHVRSRLVAGSIRIAGNI